MKLLFITCVCASFLLGGGWNQKKGKGFFKLETRYLKASKFYNSDGVKNEIPTFKNYYTSLYGEYGASDKVTFVGKIPYISQTLNEQVTDLGTPISAGEKASGLGDVLLGIRYGTDQEGSFVHAVYLETEISTGENNKTSILMLGDGEMNTKLLFEIGASFGNNGYTVASFGYNFRGKGFENELMFNLEYGYNISKAILTAFKIRGVYPRSLDSNGISSAFQQSEYTTMSVDVNYFITSSYGATFSYETAKGVKNNFSAPVLSLGFFLTI